MIKHAILFLLFLGTTFTTNAENLLKPRNQQALNTFAKMMLEHDGRAYLSGEKSRLARFLPDLTVTKLVSEYTKNNAGTIKKYQGKWLRIRGQLATVESDSARGRYVIIHGEKPTQIAQLYLDEKTSLLPKPEKESLIDMVCQADRVQSGVPVFKSCSLTQTYTKALYDKAYMAIQQASSEHYFPSSTLEANTLLHYLISESVIESSCAASKDECAEALYQAAQDKRMDSKRLESIRASRKQLKTLPRLPDITAKQETLAKTQ